MFTTVVFVTLQFIAQAAIANNVNVTALQTPPSLNMKLSIELKIEMIRKVFTSAEVRLAVLLKWEDYRVNRYTNSEDMEKMGYNFYGHLNSKFWTPELVLSKFISIGEKQKTEYWIRPVDNNIVSYTTFSIKTRCQVRVWLFPLDRIYCYLFIRIPNLPKESDLILQPVQFNSKTIEDSTVYIESVLIENYGDVEDFTMIHQKGLKISFANNISALVIHTVLPSCLLVVTSWISFWIDCKCTPARSTAVVTVVLAMLTHISTSRGMMPNEVTLIHTYSWICFLFIIAAAFEFVVSDYLQFQCAGRRNESNLAQYVNVIARIAFPLTFILYNVIFLWYVKISL